MTVFAVASYRPLPGQDEPFLELLRQHLPILRAEGLVSERPEYTMRAQDGTIIQVFEWLSHEAKERAHESVVVMALWDRFFEVAEMVHLGGLKEAEEPFAAFEAVCL